MSNTMRDKRTAEHLRRQIRQLILLRETGPKSAAWHAARARLIWRLQDEVKRVGEDSLSSSRMTGNESQEESV
jgi:hypothetical protein